MSKITITPALIASAVSGLAGLVGALIPSTAPLTKGIIASSGMIGMIVFGMIHAVEVSAAATRTAASINAATVTPILHVDPRPPAPTPTVVAGPSPADVDARIDERLRTMQVSVAPAAVPPVAVQS